MVKSRDAAVDDERHYSTQKKRQDASLNVDDDDSFDKKLKMKMSCKKNLECKKLAIMFRSIAAATNLTDIVTD